MPGRCALIYKVSIARSPKTEAEYFPTIRVIPPAGGCSPQPGAQNLAHGFSLGVEAIRNLDPETGRMVVTLNGKPGSLPIGEENDDSVPVFEKNGWRVFIDWDSQAF